MRIQCPQCQLMTINGVICHEIGCPNAEREWVDGEWVIVPGEDEDGEDLPWDDGMASGETFCACGTELDDEGNCPVCAVDSDLLAADDAHDTDDAGW